MFTDRTGPAPSFVGLAFLVTLLTEVVVRAEVPVGEKVAGVAGLVVVLCVAAYADGRWAGRIRRRDSEPDERVGEAPRARGAVPFWVRQSAAIALMFAALQLYVSFRVDGAAQWLVGGIVCLVGAVLTAPGSTGPSSGRS